MIFSGKDARYIGRVLRLKRGDKIVGFDGKGNEYVGTIAIMSPRRVEAVIEEERTLLKKYSARVGLAQAVIKSSGTDRLLRPAVELGISDFYPLRTSRTVVKPGKDQDKKLARWGKIALDAVRQSGRVVAPVIHPFRDWKGALCLVSEFDLCLLPWERETEKTLREVFGAYPPGKLPGSVLVVIGPEGGFTEREVQTAVDAGFRTVSLSPATLRANTAALTALSCVQYELNPGGA